MLGIIWGSNFIFMKWASETITATQMTFLRVLCGFVPVLIYALARRSLKLRHFRYTHHFIVMSLLATSLYYFAFAAGTALLPSGIAGALAGAVPLFTFLAAAVLLREERPTTMQVIGALISFAGVGLIARPWDVAQAADPLGVVYMVLGSASVGISFVYARKFLIGRDIPATALTTYQMGFSVVTLALITDFSGITAIVSDTRGLLSVTVGMGLFGTGIAFIFYYFIVDTLGAVAASGTTYIPPVVALIIGWAVANETIDLTHLAAMGLILLGLLVIRLFARPQLTPRSLR